jgi:hypothetical protein
MTLVTSTVLALLAVHTAQSAPSGGNDAKAAEPSVVRAYDLESVLPGSPWQGPTETLLPYLGPTKEESTEGWDPRFGTDSLVDLLHSLCSEEFDYEGREIRTDDHGRLVVKAPPSLQGKTERYLAFLDTVFSATTELVIDSVETAEGSPDSNVPAMMPIAEADKLIARAGKGGVRTWRLQIHPGRTASLELSRVARMVTGYNVEIAQAAGIADPIVNDISVGTRVLARAAPAAGGMWLALILRRGEPLSDVKDRDMQIANAITTQDRIVYPDISRVCQSVDVLNRSLALSTYLPEGKAIAIQSVATVGGKRHAETLILRRGTGALPIFQRASLDPKSNTRDGEVLCVNAQSAAPPRIEVWAPELSGGDIPSDWPRFVLQNSEARLNVGFAPDSLDLLRDVLASNDNQLNVHAVGSALFLSHDKSATPPPGGDVSLELLSRLTPPARVAQVVVRLRRAGAGAELARCSLPLRSGEPATLVLGAEDIEVADFDVEVAQAATISQSVMCVGFDGLVLWLKPAFTPSGDLALEVMARAHFRSGDIRQLDLRVPSLGKVDQSTYDQLFAREKLVFRKAEGAARTLVIGDSGAAATKGSLTLEIEASELP